MATLSRFMNRTITPIICREVFCGYPDAKDTIAALLEYASSNIEQYTHRIILDSVIGIGYEAATLISKCKNLKYLRWVVRVCLLNCTELYTFSSVYLHAS